MGTQDLERLMKLAKYANSGEYHFTVDLDTNNSNNAILIDEYGDIITQPISKEDADVYRSKGYRPYVPDLLDMENKKIIEYQEEPKPHKGPKIMKKGHDEFSDEDKDDAYRRAGFDQLKIWETDEDWQYHIDTFLKKNLNKQP